MSEQHVFDDQGVEEPESPASYDVPHHFLVDSDDAANWVIRKIISARAYSERCEKWCKRETARAQREEQFFMWRYGQQLIDWVTRRISEQGGRRKSVCFPAGVAGFRHEPEKLIVENEQAVIEWAKANNLKITSTIERLCKSDLNAHVKATGELPDCGVRLEASKERFFVK